MSDPSLRPWPSCIDPAHWKLAVDLPGERVWEPIVPRLGPGMSEAFAQIWQSVAHYHERTHETYIVVEGRLVLYIIGEGPIELGEGENVGIAPDEIHQALSNDPDGCVVYVVCIPPWSPEDHHIQAINDSQTD